MIVDKNAFAPLPASGSAGGRGARAETPGPKRSTWLMEMEKQQITAWLSHPATLPRQAIPAVPAMYARIVPPAVPAAEFAAGDAPAGEAQAGQAQAGGQQQRMASAADGQRTAQGAMPGEAAGDGGRPEARDRSGRTAGNQDGVPAAQAGPQAAIEPARPAPPAAAALVSAVMAQLGHEGQAGEAGGRQAPALPPAAPAANGSPPDEVQPSPAVGLRPANPPAAPGLPRRMAEAGQPGLPAEGGDHAADVQGKAASRAERAGRAAQAMPQLRIHTVRTESGVRIWIGADQAVGLTGQELLFAALDIRRLLRDQGTPLASLTYNGESVFDGDDAQEAGGGLSGSAPAPRMRTRSGTSPRNDT